MYVISSLTLMTECLVESNVFKPKNNMKLILQANVYFRSQISRIMFKNAFINDLTLCRPTNTTVRRNALEIVQQDDTFCFDDDLDNECGNRPMIHLNSFVNKIQMDETYSIVSQFFMFMFCRFPELYLYLYFMACDIYFFFAMRTFGPLATNVVEYMFIVSYMFNLVFYLKFNKNKTVSIKIQLNH